VLITTFEDDAMRCGYVGNNLLFELRGPLQLPHVEALAAVAHEVYGRCSHIVSITWVHEGFMPPSGEIRDALANVLDETGYMSRGACVVIRHRGVVGMAMRAITKGIFSLSSSRVPMHVAHELHEALAYVHPLVLDLDGRPMAPRRHAQAFADALGIPSPPLGGPPTSEVVPAG
jgi:hypothetical protein